MNNTLEFNIYPSTISVNNKQYVMMSIWEIYLKIIDEYNYDDITAYKNKIINKFIINNISPDNIIINKQILTLDEFYDKFEDTYFDDEDYDDEDDDVTESNMITNIKEFKKLLERKSNKNK